MKIVFWLLWGGLILSSTGCLTNAPQKIGGTSDPVDGKFAVVACATGYGLPNPLRDGRSFSLSLVARKKAGVDEFYVTTDKDGRWNAESFVVPPPNPPVIFTLTSGSQTLVSVFSTSAVPVPFEAANFPLQNTGLYVERLVKVPGNNGRGAVLLFNGQEPQANNKRILVSDFGTDGPNPPPGEATETVAFGNPRYTVEAAGASNFMEITSPTTGLSGRADESTVNSEAGQLFTMGPRILAPRPGSIAPEGSLIAKWAPILDGTLAMPSAHKITFAEMVTNGGTLQPAAGGVYREYIQPTAGTEIQEYEVPLTELQPNKLYRFAVGSCRNADCAQLVKWSTTDFYGPRP